MNTLKIPDGGLLLAGSPGEDSSLPAQAFTLTLDPKIIQDMVRAAKSNENLHLDLGKSPTLHYGSKSHKIASPTDSTDFDIFLTQPFESTRRADRIPYSTNLFTRCKVPSKHRSVDADKASISSKQRNSSKSSSSGLDSDIEALQNGLAAHEASRERAQMIERAPDSKKASAKSKSKLLGYNSNPRSLPTSPGHNGNLSPSSTPVLSAQQQAVERAKEQRLAMVHELALDSQSSEHLRPKWTGKPEDFKSALEKVAALDPDSKKWNMKKVYWKELDVWKYNYDSQEDREKAIQNAIKQFDKQRLSASEPEWQKLLPREERGKGKCLSKLQASLAKGPTQPAPKIKVQKADDSSVTSREDGESGSSEKSRSGGEAMSRSNSGSLFSKSKKPAASATSNAKKPAPVKKTSPTKNRLGATKASGGRVLSQEIIENSDSSEDELPLARSKPRAADKNVPVSKAQAAQAARPQQPVKRPRDDSDSSSSSGTPLSKRIKQRQPPPSSKLKERPPERMHSSQGTGSSSFKSKTTSPTKSSPLAMSPPTNAADVDYEREPLRKKRKGDYEDSSIVVKRRTADVVNGDVMSKASKFKLYYQKYEALHYQISSLENPPDDKLTSLLNMRERLQNWKREIYRECSPT